ncbi:MAG: TlpA disulfide reductase family protein [Bacteroidales bacterium]
MKLSVVFQLLLSVVLLASCADSTGNRKVVKEFISPGQVVISGKIVNYDGSVKTGSITCFDIITRLVNRNIINIDATGRFIISYEVIHPSMTTLLQLGNNYRYLYTRPGDTLEINMDLSSGEMEFKNCDNCLNDQFAELRFSLAYNFREKDGERRRLSSPNADTLDYKAYCSFLDTLKHDKEIFVENYCDSNIISNEIRDLFLNEVKYEVAWARMVSYGYTGSDNSYQKRTNLPESFYKDILTDFPVNNPAASCSRNFIDYIANLKDAIIRTAYADKTSATEYFRNNSELTSEEIDVLTSAWTGDTIAVESESYKSLWNEKRDFTSKIVRKYIVSYVLDSLSKFPEGYGRDIILSQAISESSIKGSYTIIEDSTWQTINSLIMHNEIYDILRLMYRRMEAGKQQSLNAESSIRDRITTSDQQEFYDSLLNKYSGKYVYVDFWATWCGPCKLEMPFSRSLQNEFKDDNIIFLYLCCESDQESWESYLKTEQMPGEHYLLSSDELNYLKEFFKVDGYPSYAIVDPDGKIIDNPPRPSSTEISGYLTKLAQ